MGITGTASGNEVQYQQAIDPADGTLKPSFSQDAIESKGFTGTRTVVKEDSDAVVNCRTEPIEEPGVQSDSKAISQREVTQPGCKAILLGKKTDETLEAICGGTCMALVGLALLLAAGSGILSLNESSSSTGSHYTSTPPSKLQDAVSTSPAQNNEDSPGIGGLYVAGLFFITMGVAGILLTRFCSGSDTKKTDKSQSSKILDSESGTKDKINNSQSVEISMEDISTLRQSESVNRDTRTDLLLKADYQQVGSWEVESVNQDAGSSVNVEYPLSSDSDEEEFQPFLPCLVNVEAEVLPVPVAFQSESLDRVNMSSSRSGSPALLIAGEPLDETAFYPCAGNDADRLYQFIEDSAFEPLEPEVAKAFKRHVSKMSYLDFQAFANNVGVGDEVRIRESINNMVTGRFPDDTAEKREQLVQTLVEVISTFPVDSSGTAVCGEAVV
ncbi:hypothetical protein [Endozoicomonas sp. GU-1]|uniref:hypothetical protein n=1 Tax=Endozoicomonas sp. GU-1 TaxID=3009078 RepID=UPI0022B2FF8B|nr:hypothetical protein [Endozoicomonas sp. GU-1]WBA82805.1 hypothetical protein O2T12_06660 [Endozoicomonas sp. GU-1]WBA85733.1 hypothetical protein O3276_21305 [Endozoicomonas sp. GU-1]